MEFNSLINHLSRDSTRSLLTNEYPLILDDQRSVLECPDVLEALLDQMDVFKPLDAADAIGLPANVVYNARLRSRLLFPVAFKNRSQPWNPNVVHRIDRL